MDFSPNLQYIFIGSSGNIVVLLELSTVHHHNCNSSDSVQNCMYMNAH